MAFGWNWGLGSDWGWGALLGLLLWCVEGDTAQHGLAVAQQNWAGRTHEAAIRLLIKRQCPQQAIQLHRVIGKLLACQSQEKGQRAGRMLQCTMMQC